jgi:drug/metabolite transporter (DMT)-like permease
LAIGLLSSTNLGLSAAVSWGAADFAGGLATRRATPFLVTAIAHGLSLLALILLILLLHIAAPSWINLLLGLCAGIAGGFGLIAFYHALTLGPMGLTAALTGLLTAIVPVLFSFLGEGLPKPIQLAGFVVAILAIWMVANPHGGSSNGKALWFGSIGGMCFGVLLVFLKMACEGGVLWAMTSSRTASTSIAIAFLLLRKKPIFESKGFGWLAILTGLLDTGGNLLYSQATRIGRMDIAAVLSSLYPAITILLAIVILKERATRMQILGIAMALVAVAMISF